MFCSTRLIMKNFIFTFSFIFVFFSFFSCSKDDSNNNSNNTNQNFTLKVDGVSKTFQIQATKINGVINVVGTSTSSSKTSITETFSFIAYEDPLLNRVFSFSYTLNGVNYYSDNNFVSNLSEHSGGKLKGSLSGVLTNPNNAGQTKTITDCSFDFSYTQENSGSDDISNELHMSFSTPDWNRFINCDLLNLSPWPIDESLNYVTATSASTNQSFYFSIPADSSAMVLSSNLKKYYIRDHGMPNFQSPFEFSQKLPLNPSSNIRLISSEGINANSYNEVAAISYVGSETNFAVFKVKCRYKMIAYQSNDPSNTKVVTGTYHLKVRTSKN